MSFVKRIDDGVSICIPNWNHRNFLGRSIRSALVAAEELEGHGFGCQIVIVDDFSRDGSQRILKSIALFDPRGRLDVIFSEQNRGLGSSRNTALAHSKYRAVCFMDADNELIPENLVTFLRAFNDTQAAFLYGNLLIKDGSKVIGLLSNDVLRDSIYHGNYIDAFAIVNADIVEECGGYYGAHAEAHEDWELLLHLIAENQEIVFVPLSLGYYHVSNLSMIKTVKYEHNKMWRVYSQRKTGFPAGYASRRIYHPDIGWI